MPNGVELNLRFTAKDIEKKLGVMLKDVPKQASEAMLACAEKVSIPAMKLLIAQKKISATGELEDSLKARIRFSPRNPVVEIVAEAPHALDIELGREPHTPDFNKLVEWVAKKKKEAPIKEVARKVSKKIKEEGTDPKPFMVPAFVNSQDEFFDCFVQEMRKKL